MSIALQMQVEALREEVKELTKTITDGLTQHSETRFAELTGEITDLKNKYHMLNARVTKYKVD